MIFFRENTFANLLSSSRVIVFACTLVLIFDVVVLGNGRLAETLLGFNLRKVIFLILSVSLLLHCYLDKALKREINYFLVMLPIAVFFVWSICIPLIYGRVFDSQYTGNYDFILTNFRNPSSLKDFSFILNLSFKESLVLFAFSILPLFSLFYKKNSGFWLYVKATFFISIVFLMVIHLFYVTNQLLCNQLGDLDCHIVSSAYTIYDAKSERALNFLRPTYGLVTNQVEYYQLRFSVVSSVFMGILFMYPLFNLPRKLSSPIIYLSIILCLVTAIFYTGLRGILLAIILGFILFIFLRANLEKCYDKIYRLVFILIALTAALVFIVSSSSILSQFGLDRIGSDSIRYTQGHVLIGEIFKYPLFGNGFGSVIEGYQRLFSFEQYILALVMKVGIIGLLVFYFYMKRWIDFYQNRELSSFSKEEKNRYIGNTIGLISIFVLTATNPYLFNFVGFVFLLFFVVDHAVLTSKYKSSK